MQHETKTTRFRMLIEDLIPRLGSQEEKIARWMLDNEDKVVDTPLKEIAEYSGVSQPTVVRFCKKLGCNGTKDFKIFFDSIKSGDSRSTPCCFDDSEKTIYKKVFSSSIETIERSFSGTDWCEIDTLSEKLISASDIFIYGIGGSSLVASYLASELNRLGLRAIVNVDPFSIRDIATSFQKDDMVVFVTRRGENPPLVNIARSAREKGAGVVAITSASDSTIASLSDTTVTVSEAQYLENDRNSYSRLGQLALISSIYIMCAKKLGDRNPEFRENYFGLTNYKGHNPKENN
ncbi:MAG: MurR/RpiR family transcriptional regulator [Candidatus Ornithospirochaeta sp.]